MCVCACMRARAHACLCSCNALTLPPLQEWAKDSDDAVDGAGSVLSSSALVCRVTFYLFASCDSVCRSARASMTLQRPEVTRMASIFPAGVTCDV